MTTMTIMGRAFDLDPQRVERALEGELPEPIHEHFVVISGRRWPPKQVLALVTGLDRADFTTHQARRALTRLGFTAARAIHRGASRAYRAQAGGRREGAGAATAPGGGTAAVHRPVGRRTRRGSARRSELTRRSRVMAGSAPAASAVNVPRPRD